MFGHLPTNCMPDLADDVASALGEGYLLERELAPGGMSRVFLALDRGLDRRVVVKVLDPRLGATISAERFQREIRVAAHLQHANIVPVLSAGEVDGLPMYIMPYVEGASLRERLKRQPRVPLAEAIWILRDIATALDFAHSKGIVHRDIKPENVLLSGGGHSAVVTDFGVAKALADAESSARGDTITQVGTAVGTPAYMAPEQIIGAEVDARTDLYSWGVLAYELLAGHPFDGKVTPQQLFAAQLNEMPQPLGAKRPDLPPSLLQIIERCLAKEPEERPQSAAAIVETLEGLSTLSATWRAPAKLRDPRTWHARHLAAAALALLAVVATPIAMRQRQAIWARDEAIPSMRQLVEEGQFEEAYRLLRRAREAIGRDSAIAAIESTVVARVVLTSTPPGAKVYRQAYRGTDSTWESLGVTPTDTVEVPRGLSRFRYDLPGYVSAMTALPARRAVLRAATDTSREFVPFSELRYSRNALPIGLRHLNVPIVPPFELARYEATNSEYRAFVEAGGYRRRELWDSPILRAGGGRPLSWDSAMALMVDRTGRPGPSTWEAGTFPSGQERHPVTGISWYEARAFARFAGASLPTVYHWAGAAALGAGHFIIPESNFATSGTQPVGSMRAVTPAGLADFAGNAREWLLNADRASRYIGGGGAGDMPYSYLFAIRVDAFDRSPINGVRLARYAGDSAKALMGTMPFYARDLASEKPVPDAVFAVIRRLYDYDPAPLLPRITRTDTTTDWIYERIVVTSPEGVPLPLDFFRPRHTPPPYQTLVHFHGAGIIRAPARNGAPEGGVVPLIRSGRAVLAPVFKGTYERSDELSVNTDRSSNFYRDRIVLWGREVRRAVEYLVTRPDVDTARIGYSGFSQGGRVGPINLVVEPRFKVAVMNCPGIVLDRAPAEADPFNFLPRVRVPTLMVGGRLDGVFPLELSQVPYYQLLGVSERDKRHVVVDAGHCPPREMFYSEALPWLDRYLGPVTGPSRDASP